MTDATIETGVYANGTIKQRLGKKIFPARGRQNIGVDTFQRTTSIRNVTCICLCGIPSTLIVFCFATTSGVVGVIHGPKEWERNEGSTAAASSHIYVFCATLETGRHSTDIYISLRFSLDYLRWENVEICVTVFLLFFQLGSRCFFADSFATSAPNGKLTTVVFALPHASLGLPSSPVFYD